MVERAGAARGRALIADFAALLAMPADAATTLEHVGDLPGCGLKDLDLYLHHHQPPPLCPGIQLSGSFGQFQGCEPAVERLPVGADPGIADEPFSGCGSTYLTATLSP